MGENQKKELQTRRKQIGLRLVQVVLDEEDKKCFWEVLDEVVRGVPSWEKIFLRGDFNGQIGSFPLGYDDVHGGFGFWVRYDEGAALLDFARAFGKGDRALCKDYKVIPSENLATQHKLLVMNLVIKKGKKSQDAKKKVEMKKTAYAKWIKSKLEEEKWESREEYKLAKNEAKLGLEEKGGENRGFKISKVKERKGQDPDQVKYINKENDRVLVEDALIKKRWKSYFHRLLNDEGDGGVVLGELDHSGECLDGYG
ncbi:uncharacterized protein LOC124888893 [Capsicum annuum]|uniref:uncharacterized protein LOC124888893 n=1 Tax=Capsicum annuum TaxID=4072 RepID=UPI001FB0E710|nr:uncharacterized protein LOC124888893 [Capsicum annuum]